MGIRDIEGEKIKPDYDFDTAVRARQDETRVGRIRDIDGDKINELVEAVLERGLVITPTIFGVKIPITIKIGQDNRVRARTKEPKK